MKIIDSEDLSYEGGQKLRDQLLQFVSTSVASIQVDCRDPWPTDSKKYIKGETLSSGNFGSVKAADCYNSNFGFTGNDSRRCVVKTIYYRKRLEAILGEKVHNPFTPSTSTEEKLCRFLRRTFMEVYVLSRCRHENIMHCHALFFSDHDLYMILPRFYVLHNLIEIYREKYDSEPVPVAVIARIIRQICIGLQFLQKIGIMHRDVQPDNIFITRNGTVKLGHFAQSRSLLNATKECVTPVGKEEFMAFEKHYNLEVTSRAECLSYSYSADVWSLGVLVLQMTTYFPNEPFHKLPKNFATLMHEDRMPFVWFTTNMMQLRSRLAKSGGEELKSFLSDKLLGVHPKDRPTPSELLNTKEMRKWCSPKIEDDKLYLRKKFIDDLDFANQFKLEAEGSNYDYLESKDIPAEFYWDDSWKKLDDQHFGIDIETFADLSRRSSEFRWGDPSPLFSIFYPLIESNVIELSDLLLIEPAVDRLAFELIEEQKEVSNRTLSRETFVILPPTIFQSDRFVKITLKITANKRLDSFGWSTDSESDNGSDRN